MPTASRATAAHRRRHRTASLAVPEISARLPKCVQAATPPMRADSGRKRGRQACSSPSSDLPASCARPHPSPAPARKTPRRRRHAGSSAALFLILDMVAVLLVAVELATEEAGVVDQVKRFALSPRSAGLNGILEHLLPRPFAEGDVIGVEAAQDTVLVGVGCDVSIRHRRGSLELAPRPEAERGSRSRRAANP